MWKLSLVTLCSFFLLGCATSQPSQKEGAVPEILLDAGKKLGADFSDPIFAQQTKCYKNPFEDYYLKTERSHYIICYSDNYPLTRIFWVKPSLTVEDLVQKNTNDVASVRIKNGYRGVENKNVTLIQEKNKIVYHKITMDTAYNLTQATFFVVVKEREINLTLAVMVRGASLQYVEEKAEAFKKALASK